MEAKEHESPIETEIRLVRECDEHTMMLKLLKSNVFITLKYAMIKYMEQIGDHWLYKEETQYSYNKRFSNNWYLAFRYFDNLMEIQKIRKQMVL